MTRLASGQAAAASPEVPPRRDSKRCRPACAAARLLSLCVQAAVMAAALALFLLFAVAAAILLLHLVVASRAFRHGHRLSPPPPTSSPPPRLGLSPTDLRLLPCFAFAATSPSSSQLCAVCLEAARPAELWRALPVCGHAFHAACVDRWLARSPACPVCRAAVAVSVSVSVS